MLILNFILCLKSINLLNHFTNAGVMAANGLGYPVSIEGAAKYWREVILVQRRISPEITTCMVIAWRRNIPYSLAVRKMIEEINAFQAFVPRLLVKAICNFEKSFPNQLASSL